MSRTSKNETPARLEKVRRRFDDWRRGHRARSRLPELLWAAAVELGREYGINRTARALRLDYYSLKKRVEACSRKTRGETIHLGTSRRKVARRGRKATAPGHPEGPALATFLEVGPFPPAILGECIVELEETGGAKLRVHLKGVEAIERAAPELAILARSFRGVRG